MTDATTYTIQLQVRINPAVNEAALQQWLWLDKEKLQQYLDKLIAVKRPNVMLKEPDDKVLYLCLVDDIKVA